MDNRGEGKDVRIMVIDDEPQDRNNLIEVLKEQYPSAQIDEYEDGTPAWEAIQQDHGFDLVITDMSMITMDGMELSKRIHEKYPDMQILFETAESERTLRQMGVQIERCLLKPVFEQELREKIEHLSDLPEFEIKIPEKEVKIPQAVEKKRVGVLKRMFHSLTQVTY